MGERISKKTIGVIWAAAGVCLLIGSLYDFQISSAIASTTNPFGIFFAGWGMVPNYLLGVCVGFLMIEHRSSRRTVAVLQVIWGAIFTVGFSLFIGWHATRYIRSLPLAALIIGLVIGGLTCWFLHWALADASYHDVMHLILALFILAIAATIIVNTVKIPWERPRMRLLMSDAGSGLSFHPWYQPGCPEREAYIEAGVARDDFKSFPSGHTCAATAALSLYYIAGVSRKLRAHRRLCFGIGMAWVITVAFSRIVAAAHFLSDVTVGFAIAFAAFLIVGKIFYPDNRAYN